VPGLRNSAPGVFGQSTGWRSVSSRPLAPAAAICLAHASAEVPCLARSGWHRSAGLRETSRVRGHAPDGAGRWSSSGRVLGRPARYRNRGRRGCVVRGRV